MRAFKTQVVYATKLQSDYAHRGPADGGSNAALFAVALTERLRSPGRCRRKNRIQCI